ncbi:unnamed protein product [Rotaria magnacalcarata]|uniref:Antistasin-like domain-containing protein n=2 Tax=Rotaria magnacalcarata TaxID=392030 RepID=A0A816QQ58_9BILA|nr:unnamed protein product [Rotaria magnacalcarata]CAF4024375.1 unnamed protein product [Rotaria magnacalcarata]
MYFFKLQYPGQHVLCTPDRTYFKFRDSSNHVTIDIDLEDIQNPSNKFQSFDTVSEITLQTAFDNFMLTLLTSFKNNTALRYLDGFSADCTYIFKNGSIESMSVARVLENFVICFGELKSSTNGNIKTAAIGQIGRYLYMLNKTRDRRKICAFLYDFHTITFFYCEKMLNKNDLRYYQSETLKLIEDNHVKQSNFDIITIGKESREINFSKENWTMFIEFLTMNWQFYDYKMLNISPSYNLLGNSYEIAHRLGTGATSFVYLLKEKQKKRNDKSKFCVMKILRNNKLSLTFQGEMEIIKQLREEYLNSSVFPNILDSFSSVLCAKSDDANENSNLNTLILHPICPLIKCIAQNCANGFIVNQYGCTTCECNPCKFGQPLFQYPCGQGQRKCAANEGLCKVSQSDNAYCCPNEHGGCCPPVPFPINFLCLIPNCKNDTQCQVGQKCCRPCSRCINATLA